MRLGTSGAERARLATLERYGILDSEPEQAFDDLAKLAAVICDASAAQINFIDSERQWFKSAPGLGARVTLLLGKTSRIRFHSSFRRTPSKITEFTLILIKQSCSASYSGAVVKLKSPSSQRNRSCSSGPTRSPAR